MVPMASILFQGVQFDPDLPQTIRLEFAKSNTKASKPKQQSPPSAAPHPTIIHTLSGRKSFFQSSYSFVKYVMECLVCEFP